MYTRDRHAGLSIVFIGRSVILYSVVADATSCSIYWQKWWGSVSYIAEGWRTIEDGGKEVSLSESSI